MKNIEASIGQAATKIAEDIKANCIISVESLLKSEFSDSPEIDVKVNLFKKVKPGVYSKEEYKTKIRKAKAGSVRPVRELLMEVVNKKMLKEGERVVFVGDASIGAGYKSMLFVFDVDTIFSEISKHNLAENIHSDIIESVINLALEISREGREGNSIGTAFVLGNKEELANLKKQVADLNSRITKISTQLKGIEAEIVQREDDLAFAREIFEEKAVSQYKFSRLYDPIAPFLFSESASGAFREISFRQKAADEDRKTMDKYADDLVKLKNDKDTLAKNKAGLASLQKKVSENAKFLEGEVNKVETYISSLTAKQNELAAAKAGGFETFQHRPNLVVVNRDLAIFAIQASDQPSRLFPMVPLIEKGLVNMGLMEGQRADKMPNQFFPLIMAELKLKKTTLMKRLCWAGLIAVID